MPGDWEWCVIPELLVEVGVLGFRALSWDTFARVQNMWEIKMGNKTQRGSFCEYRSKGRGRLWTCYVRSASWHTEQTWQGSSDTFFMHFLLRCLVCPWSLQWMFMANGPLNTTVRGERLDWLYSMKLFKYLFSTLLNAGPWGKQEALSQNSLKWSKMNCTFAYSRTFSSSVVVFTSPGSY